MKTVTRTTLPLSIKKDDISFVLLSPLERHALSAEQMNIPVLKVVVRKPNWATLEYYKEGAYCGKYPMSVARSLYNSQITHTYYYIDANSIHLEKKIRKN